MQAFSQKNKEWAKCLTINYFQRTILVLVGTMSSWFKKLISGGRGCNKNALVCIFEEVNSRRGGRFFWTGEKVFASTVISFSMSIFFILRCFHALIAVLQCLPSYNIQHVGICEIGFIQKISKRAPYREGGDLVMTIEISFGIIHDVTYRERGLSIQFLLLVNNRCYKLKTMKSTGV